MFHAVFSRLLSVATVLTLLVFAASAGLQPEPALASPGVAPDLSVRELTNERKALSWASSPKWVVSSDVLKVRLLQSEGTTSPEEKHG